jgi:hypothetical protein
MPKRKPETENEEIQDELITSDEQAEKGKWGGSRPRKPTLRIPITSEGTIDMDRVRKNPEVLEKARAALGMAPGEIGDAKVPEVAKVPREFVPWVYDGVAWTLGNVFKLAKWPKIMTDEERAQFVAGLHYSNEFKEKAKEPTGALLDRAVGNSKIAAWLMEHSELAILGKMFAEETVLMVQRAALPVIMARQTAEETKKANGGFPPSENREIVTPVEVQ